MSELSWEERSIIIEAALETDVQGAARRFHLAQTILRRLESAETTAKTQGLPLDQVYAYPFERGVACGAKGTYDGSHVCGCNYRADFCTGHYHMCYCGSDWFDPTPKEK